MKKEFVGAWADNMGTGIMMSEGEYDPATKTFIYSTEIEAIPGMKQKVREVISEDHGNRVHASKEIAMACAP